MNFESKYNTKVPAVKRLMLEALELNEATEDYCAYPLEDNLFEWHFTVRGASGTEFENGLYHGRILLPSEYPLKPPNIILLTPNGRFEVNKKICLSISGHHPETWIPSWSIRTALLALIAFMPTPGKGTLGSLDYTSEERKVLAKKSLSWSCQECGNCNTVLGNKILPLSTSESQLISRVIFKGEEGSSTNDKTQRKNRTDIEPKQDEIEISGSKDLLPKEGSFKVTGSKKVFAEENHPEDLNSKKFLPQEVHNVGSNCKDFPQETYVRDLNMNNKQLPPEEVYALVSNVSQENGTLEETHAVLRDKELPREENVELMKSRELTLQEEGHRDSNNHQGHAFGFWISERTSNALIAAIVLLLSFLVYRRLFVL